MSIRQYSKSQKQWFRVGYGVIVERIKQKLHQAPVADVGILHLLWRLGINEYRSGDCDAAIRSLEKLLHMIDFQEDYSGCKIKRKVTKYDVALRSTIHQTIARSATYKFLHENIHEFLEVAYRHYQLAVECIIVDLSAMIELPTILVEFGTVLELYGAFEAAMTTYSKILTQYPTCRCYFNALYRSAIVGRHLGSISNDVNYQQEALEKTIDILQFLLEALPSNIQDIHIVFFYARTFEVSTNLQIRYRAQGAYLAFFELCKKREFLIAADTEGKNWIENPITWFELGKYLEKCGEKLLAKDAFNKFVEEAKKRSTFEKDLSEILDVSSCITLAVHFASYQNYIEAIKYAEIGLKIDRFDKQLRNLIGKWSTRHAQELKKDVIALQTILQAWKSRCWSWGFIKKLKDRHIVELELRLQENYFDCEVRKQLSYYARSRYRPKFLFESVCAQRIQNAYRKYRKTWIWQEAQRREYGVQATELHHRFMRDPFRKELRNEVAAAVNHKFMPRKHPLHLALRNIVLQNRSIEKIVRCIKAYQKRRALQIRIEQRRTRQLLVYSQYVTRVQKYIRSLLAKKRVHNLRIQNIRLRACAKRIQRLWLAYAQSPDYVARRQFRQQLRNRGKAMFIFRKRLLPLVRRYRFRKKAKIESKSKRIQQVSIKMDKRFTKEEVNNAVLRLQRFYRNNISNVWLRVSRIALMHRRTNRLSVLVQNAVGVECSNQFATKMLVLDDKIDLNDQLIFERLLLHQSIVVTETCFYIGKGKHRASAEILCWALRSHLCKLQNIIFLNCNVSEDSRLNEIMDQLCDSIQQCKSIHSLMIIGGAWPSSIIQKIFQIVQIGNPRIRHLAIEKLGSASQIYDELGLFSNRLLMDFFNYTIPGLSFLSLHGCSLRDDQISLLSQGIAVNTSVRSLGLSLNWITDNGLLCVIDALKHNVNSNIEIIDFSYNLINLGACVKKSLLGYRCKSTRKSLLEMVLIGNRIHQPLLPVEFALSQRISPQFIIRYTESDRFIPTPVRSRSPTRNKEGPVNAKCKKKRSKKIN